MKKKPLLIFALFFAISLFAQKESEFGPLLEIDRGHLPNLVGENEKELFSVSYEDKTIIVETFDKETLRSVSQKEVEIVEMRGVNEKLEKLTFINDEIVYITSLSYYRDDKFELIAQSIVPESGEISRKVTLYEADVERTYGRISHDVYLSENKKSIVVRILTRNVDMGQTAEKLLLYNDKFELVTEREYTENGKGINRNSGLLVDNEGSIYFIQNDEVVILDALNDFEEWREVLPTDELEVGAYYSQIAISLNKDLDPVITAYYVTKDLETLDRKEVRKSREDRTEGDTQIEGVVFFKINSLDKELTVAEHTVFDLDFIELFKDETDRKKNYDPEIQNEYDINRIIGLNNGETLLLGEIYEHHRSGFIFRGRSEELYGDMILIHFSSEGKILWKDRLPKRQMYYVTNGYLFSNGGSAGLNFFVYPKGIKDYFYDKVIVDDDKVYLIYNDRPENGGSNNKDQKQKLFKKFRRGVPVVQTIDLKEGARKGAVNRSLVTTKFWLKPNSMFESEISDDIFYFVTYKRKMHLAKTSFK